MLSFSESEYSIICGDLTTRDWRIAGPPRLTWEWRSSFSYPSNSIHRPVTHHAPRRIHTYHKSGRISIYWRTMTTVLTPLSLTRERPTFSHDPGPTLTSAGEVSACIHPVSSRVRDRGSRPPSGTTHDINTLSRSRNWERVSPLTFKLVPCYADCIRGTRILPKCHPRANVASSNASILFFYHDIHFGGYTFRFLWPRKNLQSQTKNDFV